MDMLTALLGSEGGRRHDYEDFIERFDHGRPWEEIPDEEAAERYREVAAAAPADVYEESAAEAFARLTPRERREFVEWLRQRSPGREIAYADTDEDGIPDRFEDPRELARETAHLQQQQPDLLQQLLGGGAALGFGAPSAGAGGVGAAFANPVAKAVFAGIAAMVARRVLGGMIR